MSKLFNIIQVLIISIVFSTTTWADGWGHEHHHHHHGHHGHHGWGGYGGGYGYQPQVNNYYPQPNYYQQPPAQYYPPQPQYQGGYYDNRSHQGLAGGVVGSVFGYELGNGHPLAAGIGAAAGSFLGNGMGWRY